MKIYAYMFINASNYWLTLVLWNDLHFKPHSFVVLSLCSVNVIFWLKWEQPVAYEERICHLTCSMNLELGKYILIFILSSCFGECHPVLSQPQWLEPLSYVGKGTVKVCQFFPLPRGTTPNLHSWFGAGSMYKVWCSWSERGMWHLDYEGGVIQSAIFWAIWGKGWGKEVHFQNLVSLSSQLAAQMSM